MRRVARRLVWLAGPRGNVSCQGALRVIKTYAQITKG